MADLETEVSELLPDLMDAKQELSECGPREQLLLARWAAKTAYMWNSASVRERKVDPQHLHALRTTSDRLPLNVIVCAQQHETDRTFGALQSSTWGVEWDIKKHRPPQQEPDAYKIVFQFRRMFLLVAYYPPTSPFHYLVQPEIHIPLWTDTPVVRSLPLPDNVKFPWVDSQLALSAFLMSLGIGLV